MQSWTDRSSILLLCDKLKHLKCSVINWQTIKKKQLNADLISIDQQLSNLFENFPSQIFEQEYLNLLKSLTQRKNVILSIEEAT